MSGSRRFVAEGRRAGDSEGQKLGSFAWHVRCKLMPVVTRLGTGTGFETRPFAAGVRAATEALARCPTPAPTLVLAFSASSCSPPEFYQGVRSVVGEGVPIVGGSALGVITSDVISHEDCASAVAVVASDSLRVRLASAGSLRADARAAGCQLGRELAPVRAGETLLLFYDAICESGGAASPPLLNSAMRLLDGIAEALGPDLPVVGAGLLGDYGFGPTHQFRGSSVESDCAVGCLVSEGLSAHTAVMHGCIPLDGRYRRITAMEGHVLRELDGRPIVEIFDEVFDGTGWQAQHPIRSLSVGVNTGARYAHPDGSAHVNHLLTGLTADGLGIAAFGPDLPIGAEVQLMLRDNKTMFRAARDVSTRLLEEVASAGLSPVFALYVDCAGRTAEFSLTELEEASVVQGVMREAGVPMFGFYSGSEIAPLLGRNRGMGWTGVLTLFAEARP